MPRLIDEYQQATHTQTDQLLSAAARCTPDSSPNQPAWQLTLLASAAHDLRNTLMVIQGNAQMIRNHAAKADPQLQAALATRMEDLDAAVLRLSAQIAQLGHPPARHEIDLVALARHTAASYQALAGATCIRVVSTAAHVVGVWDGVSLARIFDNLLGNAVKYSPAGGAISIQITTEQNTDGVWAIVRVCDQGIGIPPDALPHIFTPYYRAANVTPTTPGSGLGLASVQRLVVAEGGTVTVRSRVDIENCFTIRLPLRHMVIQPISEVV